MASRPGKVFAGVHPDDGVEMTVEQFSSEVLKAGVFGLRKLALKIVAAEKAEDEKGFMQATTALLEYQVKLVAELGKRNPKALVAAVEGVVSAQEEVQDEAERRARSRDVQRRASERLGHAKAGVSRSEGSA